MRLVVEHRWSWECAGVPPSPLTARSRPGGGASCRPSRAATIDPVTIAPNDFTHLHVHSEFSLLDGLGRIDDLVDAAAAQGFDSSRSPIMARSTAPSPSTRRRSRRASSRSSVSRRTSPGGRCATRRARPTPSPSICPAGDEPGRVPEPVPPHHRRPPRRLLLQAPHRPRAPRPLQRRPGGMSACLNGEVPKALEVDDWESPRRCQASMGTSSARTTSTSSSRTTDSRNRSGSTSSSSAWRRRWASARRDE